MFLFLFLSQALLPELLLDPSRFPLHLCCDLTFSHFIWIVKFADNIISYQTIRHIEVRRWAHVPVKLSIPLFFQEEKTPIFWLISCAAGFSVVEKCFLCLWICMEAFLLVFAIPLQLQCCNPFLAGLKLKKTPKKDSTKNSYHMHRRKNQTKPKKLSTKT